MSKKEPNKYLKQKEVYQPHDKTFRKVLLNKTQAVELLNNYFEFENKIKEENIERYNCKFVNAQFRNKETDILYKVKGYDVLDINTLEKEELLNHNIFIYRILSIEKAKTTEELASTLAYLLANEKNENYREILKEIIRYIYKETLNNEEIYKYFNEENLKGEDDMSVIEMVLKERNDLLTQGRLEGKKEGIQKGKKAGIRENTENITIEMIKRNLDDSFIMQITKIDSKTLEKIKKKQKFLK